MLGVVSVPKSVNERVCVDLWEELRRQLGDGFDYGPGHWFCVPHGDVRNPDGRRFSEKTGGSGRRVVLASSHGPNATIFARSASRETPFSHPAHPQDGPHGTCRVDKRGWIAYRVPVSVPAAVLCDNTYSCSEPDKEWLLSELKRAGAL